MLNTHYSSMANLKQAYKEADRAEKKARYDAMKAAKRESKAQVSGNDKQLANALYGAVLAGYKVSISQSNELSK